MFELIRGDVETAIKSNFTYLTIHRLAAENADIFDKYNRFAEFWMLNAYSLQTTFFVTFGRIFDTRRDVYSVHRVVEDAVANPSLFSKSALRDRKRKASRISGVDPEWLVEYIDNAWEPTRADLETLMVALAPHYAKFKTIYQPIRHQVFAHKSIQDDKAIVALFEKTLSEVLKARELSQAIQIMFAEGQEQIPIKVDLSAPGFEIVGGVRSAEMTIKKKRDPQTEEVTFQLTAKSPGEKPTTCKIIAAFFQGNDCLGAVTHWTNVIPKNFVGPRTGAGGWKTDPIRISSAPREPVDLIIFVREIEAQPDSYEIALQSNILGEEYALRDMGTLKLAGTEFSNFFSRTIDPQFQQFPSDPRLTDEEFDEALAAWSASFLVELESLGRRLWGYLPPRFKDEYVRLRCLSSPPRSICVYSDETVLPWELIRPSGMVDGHFENFEPLGVAHVLGRWKPDLGARPQPQAVSVQKMVVLTPKYGTSPLYWAAKESVELRKVISGMIQPAAVDRKTVEDLLNSTGVQLVHFNGHGVWDSTGDLSALRLENNDSIPAMAFSSRTLGMESHPILYLNACSVGRGAANVGRPGGFAASCLDGGWSGVIAPYCLLQRHLADFTHYFVLSRTLSRFRHGVHKPAESVAASQRRKALVIGGLPPTFSFISRLANLDLFLKVNTLGSLPETRDVRSPGADSESERVDENPKNIRCAIAVAAHLIPNLCPDLCQRGLNAAETGQSLSTRISDTFLH